MAHETDDSAPDEARDHGLAEVEAVLSALAPQPARLSAARLMYLAGQESAASRRRTWTAWLWPATASASTAAAAVLAVLLAVQPGPHVVERIVYVTRPAAEASPRHAARSPKELALPGPAAPTERLAAPGESKMPTPYYLQARELAMSQGIDSLGSPSASTGGLFVRPATYRELQKDVVEGEYGGHRKFRETSYFSWPNFIPPEGSL